MFTVNQRPYPINAFPPRICRAAEELIMNIQVTDIIAGTSCLTALSTALSPLVDWKHPLSGQIRPCALYQAITAASGDRKSAAEVALCRPLHDHDMEALEHEEDLKKKHRLATARWRALHKRALSQYARLMEAGDTAAAEAHLSAVEAQEPTLSPSPRLIHSDTTKLSMFEALEGDGMAMALLTDEGQTLLASTVMRHFGFLNNTWDGKRLLTLDRADHTHLIAKNSRLTISFMIQPDVLADFFAKRGAQVRASGFCARVLFSRSPSIHGLRPPQFSPPPVHLLPFHARLQELLAAYTRMLESGRMTRDIIEFDEQAKQLWLQIATKVETDLYPGLFLHDISDFGNKYLDIVGRIACLLHYFEADTASLPDDPEARVAAIGQISADTLGRAEQIAGWHLFEYKALFSPPLIRSPDELDADSVYSFLYRYIHAQGKDSVLKNYVRQYGGIRDSDRLNSALQILVGRQAVQINSVKQAWNKKAKEFIVLNPAYFNTFPIH
ncbi:YfjI family protein [Lysobacter silvisoli]|uniref:DUF3987 domain-containing protein n=1 Tax=Lysobacter silvisoli TaxID=2293254 RepID=A0A371K0M5_9GAMM|nr:YfjI family protein [Lysobacter silvisoli]RDZ27454.1 DUF3987 domain-containing protein [Lysobacter silvisoli]